MDFCGFQRYLKTIKQFFRANVLSLNRVYAQRKLHETVQYLHGDAENAGLENAGLENEGPNRRGGKRGTGKRGTKSHGWKSQDWKTEDQFYRGGKRGTGKHGNIICMDSQT